MTRRRDKATPAPPPRPVDSSLPKHIPGRGWWGLYKGNVIQKDGSPAATYAGPESSMMVLGPPRSGKTSSVIIPCVFDAPAAVVSTSTKSDVLAATCMRRWLLGNIYVFDPTGTIPLDATMTPLRWSPVMGCEQFERAVSMARALASAARPARAMGESAHWVERAEALLAPLLFAAASRGRDMATVCRWILARDLREPLAVLSELGHQMAEAILAGVAATDERERSGIFSTASGLLSAYRSEAALATSANPNFDPVAFARSTDTVYICAPAHAQDHLAPLIVALLEQIRAAVYARPRNAAPVVFALDEVAGIAPLPSLPALAAEGGGQGLITLACLQDLSQARARWGEAADGFFSIFNTKLIFPGIGDQRTLQLIASLAGEREVFVRSVNVPDRRANRRLDHPIPPSTTTSVTWRPVLPPDQIARGYPGHALCITGSNINYLSMVPWWAHHRWAALYDNHRPLYSEATRPIAHLIPPELRHLL